MDKTLSPIKQRVLKYIDNKRIKKVSFFEITNISASNFKGKAIESELGGDKIVSILTNYKDINPYWLLLGEGEMLCESDTSTSKVKTTIIEDVLLTKITQLINMKFDAVNSDIKYLTKNIGNIILDLDDLKEESNQSLKEESSQSLNG